MKQVKKIFNVLFMCTICAGVAMCVVSGASWGAVTNYGCDDEDNGYISAELALCSAHAYNIGQTKNSSNAGDKELMREVIAMKTTFITQQMYKQYEQLESVIRRLKTQLEKAVLTTNLKIASGNADDDSSSGGGASYRQENRNVFMAGVSDCNAQLTTLKVFECLSTNLTTMYNVSGNGSNPTTEVRKQLANDYKVMCSNGGDAVELLCPKDDKGNYNTKCVDKISGKTDFNTCIDDLRTGIRKGYEAAQKNERQMSGNRQQSF